MRAMILAAGYGTRLWPLTADRAKPAIPFLNRPLVGYVAEYLARFGCREVMVNLHHQSDSVRAALGDGRRFGVQMNYIEEPEILGTSGALDNAREFLDTNTFIVVNGKIVTDIDLTLALETHRSNRALATLVLLRNMKRERFSIVHTENSLVTGFGGMPSGSDNDSSKVNKISSQENGNIDADAPLMFTGIQILEPRIFDYIPRKIFSHTTTDVYPQAIEQGERIAAHIADGLWRELSTVERYIDINIELMQREHNSDVVSDPSATVEAGAEVSETVLWENARVERGARVRHAILGAGVRISAGEVVENAAVVRAELVSNQERPPKGLAGEVKGENFVAPLPQ
jgi:NDP-sugar pyrophosphorylase family protein